MKPVEKFVLVVLLCLVALAARTLYLSSSGKTLEERPVLIQRAVMC